jgi:hypothetical protein
MATEGLVERERLSVRERQVLEHLEARADFVPAKANGLEPHAYFSHLFAELPKATAVDHFESLLPWNAKLALQLSRWAVGGEPCHLAPPIASYLSASGAALDATVNLKSHNVRISGRCKNEEIGLDRRNQLGLDD